MLFFAAAFGLLLLLLFWGAGLALLILPRPYRRYWPVFCAPFGLVLQSAVVWAGAFADFPGTDTYAFASLALPVALLAAGIWRWRRRGAMLAAPAKFNGLWLVMAFCLTVLVAPMAVSSKRLTTTSLGSCDAADYAAGARVLKEFARTDRSGFMGLTPVVSIASIDNFFDLWVRLNHFTPTAVIALNASLVGARPFELVSVLAAVFLVAGLPMVYWLARAGLKLGPPAACGVTLLYGLNPLTWYAVYHSALAQMLAAQAIALLTWAGVALWRRGAGWRDGLRFGGCLLAADWLTLGSYNFIVLVCLVPAVAFALGGAAWGRAWRQFGRWCALVALPLVVCLVVFWGRTRGIADRLEVIGQYDLGWRIPVLSPEGWLGLVVGPGLHSPPVWLRVMLSALLLALLAAALLEEMRRRPRRAFLALCLAGPALIGYAILLVRGGGRANAGYEAYKLLAVFYPGMLAALCLWADAGIRRRGVWRWAAAGFGAVALIFVAAADWRFTLRMQNPPLIVSRALARVAQAEELPQVDSINMKVDDFWSRLWASAFLLRKRQYFATFTYEGHRPTALLGHWDLLGGLVKVRLPNRADSVAVGPDYMLVRNTSPFYVSAELGEGWFGVEHLQGTPIEWRWSKGDADVVVDNPQPRALSIVCRLRTRSLVNRDLQLWLGGHCAQTVRVGKRVETVSFPVVTLPPGKTVLRFHSSEPPVQPGPRDHRRLGFVVYQIDLEMGPEGSPAGKI